MNRRYSAIGFDMDSTLMDTQVDYQAVVSEVGAVLREYGLDPSKWGRFEEEFASRGSPEDYARMSDEMIERCRHVEMRALPTAKPFPGSVECVDSLKRIGNSRTFLLCRHHDRCRRVHGLNPFGGPMSNIL